MRPEALCDAPGGEVADALVAALGHVRLVLLEAAARVVRREAAAVVEVDVADALAVSARVIVFAAAKGAELGFPLTRGTSASPFQIDCFRIWDFDKVSPAPAED